MLSRSSVQSLENLLAMVKRVSCGRVSCISIYPSTIVFIVSEGVKPENIHLGQPLARASRVEWGIGGLYFTVRDWRRGQ